MGKKRERTQPYVALSLQGELCLQDEAFVDDLIGSIETAVAHSNRMRRDPGKGLHTTLSDVEPIAMNLACRVTSLLRDGAAESEEFQKSKGLVLLQSLWIGASTNSPQSRTMADDDRCVSAVGGNRNARSATATDRAVLPPS